MKPRQTSWILVVAVAALLAACAGDTSDRYRRGQGETVETMQQVGQAVSTWKVDLMGGTRMPSWMKKQRPTHWSVEDIAMERVSHAELAEAITPTYIAELPAKDGWGRPYEFTLSSKLLGGSFCMRSAGRDGVFDSNSYSQGFYPPVEADKDIVFCDGIFIQQPAVEYEGPRIPDRS